MPDPAPEKRPLRRGLARLDPRATAARAPVPCEAVPGLGVPEGGAAAGGHRRAVLCHRHSGLETSLCGLIQAHA
eukprot:4970046-Pyramimonas_sp.AAC.1